MEVAALGLLWKRSLAWACSSKGDWYSPVPMSVPVSYLLLQKSLAWAWFCGGSWLGTALAEVTGLGLLLL